MSLTVRAKLDMGNYSADPSDGPAFKYTVVRANPYSIKKENVDLLKRLAIYKERPATF